MNKRLTITYLLLTSLSLHSYFDSSCSHFNKTPQAHLHLGNNQRFSNKSLTENVPETFIEKTIPIAAPFIMLGKLIVDRIKSKKNNKIQDRASPQPDISIKKQEPVCYSVEIKTSPAKPIKFSDQKIAEQQLHQLSSLYKSWKNYQLSYKQIQRLPQRICALKQSLNTDLQCSPYKSNWSHIDPTFIQEFSIDSSRFDLNGSKLQHVLQKEFHDIAQETALAWMRHRNNAYIQQLIEKNITCIKKGITYNQAGKIIEATRFADIAWAILDHIQALGKGVYQGVNNTLQTFLHPIDTIQGTAQAIYTITYSLGQATLEAIDLSILAVTDQNAAHKKLQS